MPFRKLVGSYKDYTLSTHVLEDGYLAVDVNTGSLRLGDGTTPGGIEVGGGGSIGDLSAVGSTFSAPSNARWKISIACSCLPVLLKMLPFVISISGLFGVIASTRWMDFIAAL